MTYSLNTHVNKYDFSSADIGICILTGLTGLSFSKRHWDLSEKTSLWGHRLIALAEAIPVLGGLIALIEILIYSHFQNVHFDDSTTVSSRKLLPSNPHPIDLTTSETTPRVLETSAHPTQILKKPSAVKQAIPAQLHSPQSSPDAMTDEEILKTFVTPIIDQFFPLPPSKYPRMYPLITVADTSKHNSNFGRSITNKLNSIFSPDRVVKFNRFFSTFYSIFSTPDLALTSRMTSCHGPGGLSFYDPEIVRVLTPSPLDANEPTSYLYKGKTPDGKYILQQNGIRGCTLGSAAMLVSDKLGRFISPELANLGNTDTICQFISSQGLQPIVKEVTMTYQELQRDLLSAGSAEISVSTVGNHSIIVDAITDEGVAIRDPYHGWAIIVTKEAFLKATRSSSETHINLCLIRAK